MIITESRDREDAAGHPTAAVTNGAECGPSTDKRVACGDFEEKGRRGNQSDGLSSPHLFYLSSLTHISTRFHFGCQENKKPKKKQKKTTQNWKNGFASFQNKNHSPPLKKNNPNTVINTTLIPVNAKPDVSCHLYAAASLWISTCGVKPSMVL